MDSDGVWTVPVAAADRHRAYNENLQLVTGWFEFAEKYGRIQVNLYFDPYRQIFIKLTHPVKVYGVDVGLWQHKDGLYRIMGGPGDCEENLVYVGKCKGKK